MKDSQANGPTRMGGDKSKENFTERDLQELLREIHSLPALERNSYYQAKGGSLALLQLPVSARHNWIKKFSDVLNCPMADLKSEINEQKRISKAEVNSKGDYRPQADLLLDFTFDKYEIGCDQNGQVFVTPKNGPPIIYPLNGKSSAFRFELASEFQKIRSEAPNSASISSALDVLRGRAAKCERQDVYLRIGEASGNYYLDLGGKNHHVVIFNSNRWKISRESEVLFRRSELTGRLPQPVPGKGLKAFREMLNITDRSWQLLLGWLVASFIPDVPHPVLLLSGQQGTGKSTIGRMVANTIDPSPAPLWQPPKDKENWGHTANGAWVVAVDNISNIPPWFSDALCRAVTGDSLILRRLYSDQGISVISFRRPVLLTSINPGPIRGDLTDRLVHIELLPISKECRKYDADLNLEFKKLHSEILGGLLDLVVQVLGELKTVKLPSLSRMADFERILAALDKVMGANTRSTFLGMRNGMAHSLVESNTLATAIMELVVESGNWEGTHKTLLASLNSRTPVPERAQIDWPKTAKGLSDRLQAIAPALLEVGVKYIPPKERIRGGGKQRERILALEFLDDELCPNDCPTVRPFIEDKRSSVASNGTQSKATHPIGEEEVVPSNPRLTNSIPDSSDSADSQNGIKKPSENNARGISKSKGEGEE